PSGKDTQPAAPKEKADARSGSHRDGGKTANKPPRKSGRNGGKSGKDAPVVGFGDHVPDFMT
ncbi:MAG: DEAD/DEAH box helicase, partial [Pseudomonadota bacterium]|nr:DEAD/DEAH box helicase [Pseudomonadota bacterium]